MSLVFFILLIGPLIFFHEFGHFIAARFFKVGVVRFSIGFGPKLFGFKRGETEYVVGALPLGGFVRMVGADPSEMSGLSTEERSTALWSKPVWQRAIIVLAGPLANLLIPLPIFMAFYAAQDGRLPARVGTVMAGMPADDAGLEPGDIILEVDGDGIRYFDELQDVIGDAEGKEVELRIQRGDEIFTAALQPEMTRSRDRWVGLRWVERPIIGINIETIGSVINVWDLDGPAAVAGLQTFDRIVSVNGTRVSDYPDLLLTMSRQRDGPVDLLVMRPKEIGNDLGEFFVEEPVEISMVPELRDGERYLGWRAANMVVFSVQPGSPAAEAGLQPGDEVISLNGEPCNLFSVLVGRLGREPEVHELQLIRDGQTIVTTITPRELEVTGELNQEVMQVVVGMRSLETADYYPNGMLLPDTLPMSMGERLAFGFRMGFEALFGFLFGIVIGVWQLVTGQVGLSNLGGPIMIFDLAGRAGEAGPQAFLQMMALISINLGILNLLPIPVLDGGSLLLFAIEAVKRGPISVRTRQLANYAGLVFIIMLFVLVFKNDIERYWSNFAEFFD